MTDLRDERAKAIRTRVGNGLADNLPLVLPLLLDDLDAIDRAQVPGGIVPAVMTDEEAARFAEQWTGEFQGRSVAVIPPPTDEQIAAWIERNPEAFEAWARKQQRIHGTDDGARRVLGDPPLGPAKPATRRRTAR